jgi:4-amino-4-deoxy-L-arabinose transferase-like glycosyltransferase
MAVRLAFSGLAARFAFAALAARLALSRAAARAASSPAPWRRVFLDWMDGVEAGWAIPLLLIGFIAVWFGFLLIAYIDGDLHSDVLETWTLGRSLEWGYSKHPPLMGWVARAWSSVFPLTNWSFQLMSLVNSAIALWAVDLITRRFARGDKRIVVLLLLMLMPIYQFHAQRFNANTVLLATWPIATYCFLRSFETRQIRWAIAAGLTAALAMLGKYYSVFLIVSFAFAAIFHPQRRAYFLSWAPWVSIGAGFVALVPHLQWLVETGAPPFAYALARHTGKAFAPSLIEASFFILGVAMIMAIPAVIWGLMAGSKNRLQESSHDFLRAMKPGLLLLLLVSIGTIVFPAITSVGLGADMPPLWALQGLFLFVIVMVCSTSLPIERFYLVNLAATVTGIAVAAVLVAAPVHALYRNLHPLHEGRNFYALAAAELTRQWHEQSDVALPIVGGDDGLAFAMAFYSSDHPVYEERLILPNTERLSPDTTFSQGWAALCYDGDAACTDAMERTAARAPRFVKTEFVVRSTLLGQPGASQRFAALLVPPADEKMITPQPSPDLPAVSSDGGAVMSRQDELPPLISSGSEERPSDYALRPSLFPIPGREGDRKRVRRGVLPASPAPAAPAAAAAAAADQQLNWPNPAPAATARDGYARWPVPTTACTLHPGGPGCAPAQRAQTAAVSRNAGAKTGAGVCGGNGPTDRRGNARLEQTVSQQSLPLSARLRRQWCDLSDSVDRFWRRDRAPAAVPEPQRRRIQTSSGVPSRG